MFRDDIRLMESYISEGALEVINALQKIPGIGEHVGYSFDEAQSPDELKSSIGGLFREVHQAYSKHDVATLKDYGFTHMAQIKDFLNTVKDVVTSPQEFFDAYQQSKQAPMDSGMGGMAPSIGESVDEEDEEIVEEAVDEEEELDESVQDFLNTLDRFI